MEEPKKKERKITFSLVYERLSLVYFGNLGKRLAKAYELEDKLSKAMIFTHPVVYASKLLMDTTIVGFFSIIAAIVLFAKYNLLYSSLGVLGVILPVLVLFVPALFFIIKIALLSSAISSRAHEVESELPLFASYVTSMVVSGISPERVIETVADSDLFHAIKKEAQLIRRNMRVLGLDALSAIEMVAKNHPSREFREFMMGYTSTIRGGGDVSHYLQLKTEAYFKEKERDMDKLVEKVSLILSTYMIIYVLVGLTINIVIAIQGAGLAKFIGTSTNVTLMIIMFNFILMPMLTIFMIAIVGGTLPKYHVSYLEPYLSLFISVPSGALIFSILMAMGGYKAFITPDRTNMTIAISAIGFFFIAASIPPMLEWKRIDTRERGVVRYLGSFLTDLSEIRKAGLNPEKSIIYLSSRDYGSFNPVLKKLSASLQIGLNIKRSVRLAILGYKNWFMRTIMRMLVDIIEYGGGTPQLLDTIASYGRRLSDFETQLKSALRTDTFLPYLGSILNIVSTVMIIYLMVSSISIMQPMGPGGAVGSSMAINPIYLSTLTFQLLLSLILNSWLAGLLVGKSVTTSVAGGFKHSAILAAASVAVALITINILLIPLFSIPR
ncbi:MAG: type II secretion system F family protein [Fervidicoccaceae archaeon]